MLDPTEASSAVVRAVDAVDMRQAALDLVVELGLRVFPVYEIDAQTLQCTCSRPEECPAGKHPRVAWASAASNERAQIEAWWKRWPHASIGLPTGVTNGFVVADFDGPEGHAVLRELEALNGRPFQTPTAKTGRGYHLFFSVPADSPLRNAVNIRPKLDRRGSGGYVVCAPSLHVSGQRYSWLIPFSPQGLLPVPQWLKDQAVELPIVPVANGNGHRSDLYGRAALDQEVAIMRACKEGTRNDQLNRSAFSLGTLVGGGSLREDVVRKHLLAAALMVGLGEREALRTINNGLTSGQGSPRTAPTSNHSGNVVHGTFGPSGARERSDSPGAKSAGETPSEQTRVDERGERSELKSVHTTIPMIVARWRTSGALKRVRTGIEALDDMCRGGLPIPWRVQVVGAPSAGKTAVTIVVANHLARGLIEGGACVGVLAVDEDPEDVTIRLAQLAGFTVAQAETREHGVLNKIETALGALRVRMYDEQQSIESASNDLAVWARDLGSPAVLVIDSLQTVLPDRQGARGTPREHVEANARMMRRASDQLRMLVISTSEANRAAYRDLGAPQNDIAAGAESRAIEYSAQTQLVLRTPPDHPDIIHVRVAKNRRADRGEFWLRLDRESHHLTPCDKPVAERSSDSEERAEERASKSRAEGDRDCQRLTKFVLEKPGLNVRKLRDLACRQEKWGQVRFDRARSSLEAGFGGYRLVNKGTASEQKLSVEPFSDSDEGAHDS